MRFAYFNRDGKVCCSLPLSTASLSAVGLAQGIRNIPSWREIGTERGLIENWHAAILSIKVHVAGDGQRDSIA